MKIFFPLSFYRNRFLTWNQCLVFNVSFQTFFIDIEAIMDGFSSLMQKGDTILCLPLLIYNISGNRSILVL